MVKEKQPSFKSIDLQTRIILLERLLQFEKMATNRDNCCDPQQFYHSVQSLQDKMFDDEKAMEKVIALKLDNIETLEDAQKYLHERAKNVLYSLVHDDKETSGAQIAAALADEKFKKGQPLAEKIAAHDVDEQTFDKLKSAVGTLRKSMIEKLRKYYEAYVQAQQHNPRIDEQEKNIKALIYPKDYSEPTNYKSCSGTRPFRLKVRKTGFDGKLRPDFNRFIGLFMHAGYMDSLSSKIKPKEQMKKSLEIVERYFPKQSEKVFDDFLQIDPQSPNREEDRMQRYTEISRTVYWGSMAGFLLQKYKYSKENGQQMTDRQFSDAVAAFNKKYVDSMCDGANNINMLGFVQADDSKSSKDLWDDTCDLQVASVHHKGPTIGSTFSIVEQEYPKIKSEDAQVQKASELANHLGNMCFIIGKNAHQRREPKNATLDMTAEPDPTFFVAEFDAKMWDEMKNMLPENICRGIEENISVYNNEIILSGRFPEPESRFHDRRRALAQKTAVSEKAPRRESYLEI